MKRISYSLAVASLLLGATASYARQLTPEEALASVPADMLPATTRSASPELVYTQQTKNLNTAYIYAAGSENGYMVVAADDALPALLGYADRGSLDPANIPPAMEAWLAEYGRQLEYATANGLKVTATRADHAPISPLCSTLWGQNPPFSNLCPASGNRHCPSGCTAAAFAQVAKYHNWPEKGTGTHTYSYGSFTDLTFDFGNTEFQWDLMLDNYFTSYTEEQANAVATLMAAIGNASLMQYSSDSSGAYIYDSIYGMIQYMGYDKGAYEAQRNFYSTADWDNLIYGELAAKRPVVYSGYNEGGAGIGHTFVVDGYNGDGYYHLNWGWTGTSDGYFLLSGLDPKEQGTGGSADGYNAYQSAVIGFQPAQGNSENHPVIYQAGNLKGGATSYKSSDDVKITFTNGYLQVCTMENISVRLGLNLTSISGGSPIFVRGDETPIRTYYGNHNGCYIDDYLIAGSEFPSSGTYYATPAYQYNGQVIDIHGQLGYSNKVKITISSGTIKIEQVSANVSLKATDIKLDSPLYSGKNCLVTAKITNNGDEFLGKVYAGLATTATTTRKPSITAATMAISLAPGETKEFSFYGTFMNGSKKPDAGTYYLNIYDLNNNAIGTSVEVEMQRAPGGTAKYDLTYEFDPNLQGSGTRNDPYLVGNELTFKVKIDVTSGYFDDTVTIYPFTLNHQDVFGLGDPSAKFLLSAGESATRTFSLLTSSLTPDTTIYLIAYGDNVGYNDQYIYIRRSSSGVGDLEADSNAPVEYYTLQGIRVENPSNGIFIRKQGSRITKVYLK